MLDEYGFNKTESICDEWNYLKGWSGEAWKETLLTQKSLKGSSFISAVMIQCQSDSVDMLMYYDARPCSMNGMFNTDIPSILLKGYYPFLAFSQIYELGTQVESLVSGEDIYALGAKGEKGIGVMLAYYNESAKPKEKISLHLKNCNGGNKISVYAIDENNDFVKIKERARKTADLKMEFEMSVYSTYYLKSE